MKRIAVNHLALVLSVNVAEGQSRKVKQAIAQQEKLDRLERKAYEKTRKKVLKQRYEMQTDKTRERMDETRRKSQEYNNRGKKGFFKKLFTKKKKRKKRRRR